MKLPAYANQQANFPALYERILVGPLFTPWAEVLLDRALHGSDTSLLDVACGTGIVARLGRRRLGPAARIVGVDLSPEMIGFARGVAPDVEWREGNAAALPTAPGEAFDVVTCQQGFQFFPDRAAAAREMARALAPHGRLAVAVWRSLDENPLFGDTHRIGERHAGPIRDQRHAFADSDALAALLRDAGLSHVHVETVSRRLRFPDGASFLKMNAMALVGMSAQSSTLAAEDRARLVDAIAAESVEATRRYAEGDGLAFETRANLAIASR